MRRTHRVLSARTTCYGKRRNVRIGPRCNTVTCTREADYKGRTRQASRPSKTDVVSCDSSVVIIGIPRHIWKAAISSRTEELYHLVVQR